MLLWSILAAMTAAAVLFVLRPILRAGAGPTDSADDRAFYETQIAEIDRDRVRGLIGEAEAETARTEAARRLLRSAAAETPVSLRAERSNPEVAPSTSGLLRSARNDGGRRFAAVLAAIGIPLLALPLYARYGAPNAPALPRAERVAAAEAAVKVETREGVLQIFALLEQDPRNPILLEYLVPRLLQTQRFDAAANALTIIVEELGPTAKRLTDLASARGNFAQSAGESDPEVRKLLERALELEPNYLLARFLLGQVKAADGDKDGALADLRAVEAALPPQAPVRPTVAKLIKQIEDGPAATPVPPGGDAIAALPAPDREKAIRGMVDGLDQRLAADGGKPEEWQRLVRSYVVLKDAEKAKLAYARARKALAENKVELEALDRLAKDLGVERDGS